MLTLLILFLEDSGHTVRIEQRDWIEKAFFAIAFLKWLQGEWVVGSSGSGTQGKVKQDSGPKELAGQRPTLPPSANKSI